MWSLTPNASWITITAPRASPAGMASYRRMGPSAVWTSTDCVSGITPEPTELPRDSEAAHPPVGVAGVGVEVVGDLPHHPVDLVLATPEPLVRHPLQVTEHVLEGVVGRRGRVLLPHHH